MTIWRMRIACWIPEATNARSEYVILISFPLQQWLHERASLSRYTYIDCLVLLVFCVHGCWRRATRHCLKWLSSCISRMCIRFRQNETTDYRLFHRSTVVLLHNYDIVHGNMLYVVAFTSKCFSIPRKIFKHSLTVSCVDKPTNKV